MIEGIAVQHKNPIYDYQPSQTGVAATSGGEAWQKWKNRRSSHNSRRKFKKACEKAEKSFAKAREYFKDLQTQHNTQADEASSQSIAETPAQLIVVDSTEPLPRSAEKEHSQSMVEEKIAETPSQPVITDKTEPLSLVNGANLQSMVEAKAAEAPAQPQVSILKRIYNFFFGTTHPSADEPATQQPSIWTRIKSFFGSNTTPAEVSEVNPPKKRSSSSLGCCPFLFSCCVKRKNQNAITTSPIEVDDTLSRATPPTPPRSNQKSSAQTLSQQKIYSSSP
jgi:hypothetical protein